jgi:hypothetical protein
MLIAAPPKKQVETFTVNGHKQIALCNSKLATTKSSPGRYDHSFSMQLTKGLVMTIKMSG